MAEKKEAFEKAEAKKAAAKAEAAALLGTFTVEKEEPAMKKEDSGLTPGLAWHCIDMSQLKLELGKAKAEGKYALVWDPLSKAPAYFQYAEVFHETAKCKV